MIGLLVMLAFQLCTSELNEIDEVIGNQIEVSNNSSNSFLAQYFKSDDLESSISSSIEDKISYDFNNSEYSSLESDEISAKWNGDVYFESGNYEFSVTSDKGIKVLIDNEVVLYDWENSTETTYTIYQQLDGVHKVNVEYNIVDKNLNDDSRIAITNELSNEDISRITDSSANASSTTNARTTSSNSRVAVSWKKSKKVTYYNKLSSLLRKPGKNIYLQAAIYVESKQVVIPAGKSLIGKGMGQTIIKANSSLYYNRYNRSTKVDKFLIKMSGNNSAISNLTLQGDNKKAWGGLYIANCNNIKVRSLKFDRFYFMATYIFKVNNLIFERSELIESSMTGKNWETAYMTFNYLKNSEIRYNKFKGTKGGGMKVKFNRRKYYLENLKIHHNEFKLSALHAWKLPNGRRTSNYAFEVQPNYVGKRVEFYSNKSNVGISIIKRDGKTTFDEIYIHDNRFDLSNGATNVYELQGVDAVIERDYVRNSKFIVANFARAGNYRTGKIKIKNCVFDFQNKGQVLLYQGATRMDRFEMTQSTIYVGGYSGLNYLLTNKPQRKNTLRNVYISNNVFVNKSKRTIPITYAPISNSGIANNKFEGKWKLGKFTKNENRKRILRQSGAKPMPYFKSNVSRFGASF